MSNRAFEEGTPSLFVIDSPLQAICAIEAINQFKVEKYDFILLLVEDIRNAQLFALLKQYNIKYEIVNRELIGGVKERLDVIKNKKGGYKRVFIGNPRNLSQYYVAYKHCENGTNIVYLDDGDDNISLLKGHSFKVDGWRGKESQFFFQKFVPFIRRIKVGHDLFTIYADIENPKYSCVLNSFNYFSIKQTSDLKKMGIYFIGTNHGVYCHKGNYPEPLVREGLEKCLKKMKEDFPNDNLYYIPHGRDVATFPQILCEKYNINYLRPEKTIELLFLDLGIIPKAIIGFTSTALYNIKLLFPSTDVYNCTFEVNHTSFMIEQVKIVSEYYKEHGIIEITLNA